MASHQHATLSDDSIDANHPNPEFRQDQNIQTYVMNFLSDAETNHRESVIQNGRNKTVLAANEDETVKAKSTKHQQKHRNINQPGKQRTRIKYSSEQLAIFEETYRHTKFISTTDRNKLAEKMNLDSKHLKFWWRNRRQKDNKSGIHTKASDPEKKPNTARRRLTSAAPTPSPTPSNFSSSCSMDQWQPSPYMQSIEQPIDSQIYNGLPQFQDSFSMPYQQAPVQYMTHRNHFPYDDSNLFPINGPYPYPYSYPYASYQSNGMEMVCNATNQNLAPSQYYYEDNTTMNGHFSYSSDPSAQFQQQVKFEPLDLTLSNPLDGANINCTEMDGLMGYWQQMKCEFSDYIPSDQ